MPAQAGENGAPRVSPMAQGGRPISPPVLSAAEVIRRRAIHHAERLLVDPAVAANLLEEAAATVSRALKAKNTHERPVEDLESYLFRACSIDRRSLRLGVVFFFQLAKFAPAHVLSGLRGIRILITLQPKPHPINDTALGS